MKPHPEFQDYLFDEQGNAYRKKKSGKLIKLIGTKCGNGYRAISFCVNGVYLKREYIHRMVCKLFNGGDGVGLHCRHLDGDITNNAASNLAWGTPLDNAADMKRHGTTAKGERNPMAVLTEEKVKEMRKVRSESGKTYLQIANEFGVSKMTAFRAVTQRAWI